MKILAAIAFVTLAACGMSESAGDDDQCDSSISVSPSSPYVDEPVTVTASITDPFGGIPTIDWSVRFNQNPVTFESHGSYEISFVPTEPGRYDVEMTPSSSGSLCPSRRATIDVLARGGNELDVRLHVIPPAGVDVPPIDRIMVIPPGSVSYSLDAVVLDPGRITTGTVGMPAYIRFMPNGQPEAIVEAYTSATGAFSARVQTGAHRILVVPNDATYPPQVIDDAPGAAETYVMTTGTAITGLVRRPNATGLAGAKVQLVIDDVPSTVATTAADGTFTLRAQTATILANARVIVTPPAGSGLPRLEAESDAFTLSSGLTIAYATSLVTRNVAGTDIVRSGPLANAKVTIVGTLLSAGTVTAGAAATARGIVRIAATADGTGALSSTLVPAAPLFAVISPANGDHAVAQFDTTTVVPASITAPAMMPFSTTVRHAAASISGARLELVPAGALELAGVGPTVLYASTNGTLSGSLANGGVYTARISDPSRTAGATYLPSATSMPSTLTLPDAIVITGALFVQGTSNPIVGGAVEVLCNADGDLACEGVERSRALGEDASDSQGMFAVAITAPPPS